LSASGQATESERSKSNTTIHIDDGAECGVSSLIQRGFPMRNVTRFLVTLAAALTTVVASQATASAATAIEYGLIAVV
jgi:hypothetical protein